MSAVAWVALAVWTAANIVLLVASWRLNQRAGADLRNSQEHLDEALACLNDARKTLRRAKNVHENWCFPGGVA